VADSTFWLAQSFQLQAGNIYTASVWMRGLPGTIGKLFVMQNASPYTIYFSTSVVLTSAWQQVSTQGYISATGPGILIISAAPPATLWVDDAALSYIPGVLAPAPNPGTIAPSFFGMHVRNVDFSRLLNGGLEPPYYSVGVHNQISGDVATGWVDNSYGDVTVAYSQDTNNPHTGASSQKMSVSAVASSGAVRLIQELGVTPGGTYTLKAWLRGDPATKMNLFLHRLNPSHTYASAAVSLTSNWQQVSITGQVPDSGLVYAAIK